MKVLDNDTIAAISTAIGEGGIGIVRISGPESFKIAEKIFQPAKTSDRLPKFKNRKCLGSIINPQNQIIDEVLLAISKLHIPIQKKIW